MLLTASSWLLEHSTILLRVSWIVGIGSILIASIPLRSFVSFHRLLMGFASRGKLMNYSSASKPRFSVPQSYFLHFYLVVAIWTTFLLACTLFFACTTTLPVIGVPELFECCQSVGRKCRLTVVCKALFHPGKTQSAGMEDRARAVVDGGTSSETTV